jgi:D-alanyl-D-alanine dipeptidase
MKRPFFMLLLFICSSSALLAQLNPDSIATHHNLEVIRELEVYQQQVVANPEMELVELATVIPNLGLDIKYATTENFAETAVYQEARAFARKPVAEALVRVQNELAEYDLELLVFDAYRPYAVTVKFFEIYPDPTFVADPAKGSRHNRGCAVDVTLVQSSTGLPLEMPTPYDDFTERAHPNFMELPDNQKKNRDFLIQIMKRNGFTVYPSEWWHFDFVGWEAFPLMDIPFEQL